MSITITETADRLADLAVAINVEHAACGAALRTGLEHAIRAGELLLEARGRIAHGGWLPWLREHFEGAPRTAQAYMQVARRRAELEGQDPQRVADVSFREALATLATPTVSPEWLAAEELIGAPEQNIELHFAAIMDRLAELKLCLDGLVPDAANLPKIVAIMREADSWGRHASVVQLVAERRCGGLLKTLTAMQVEAGAAP